MIYSYINIINHFKTYKTIYYWYKKNKECKYNEYRFKQTLITFNNKATTTMLSPGYLETKSREVTELYYSLLL